jgi:hypothetical protein
VTLDHIDPIHREMVSHPSRCDLTMVRIDDVV